MTISTRSVVVAGVLIAVTLVLALTGLGYFPVPNVTAQATVLHVPPIIGGVLEGPVVGAIVGLVLAISSYFAAGVQQLFAGKPVWVPLLVLGVPRVLIGIIAWAFYQALRRTNEILALGVAGVVGSLTNTAGVIGFAVLTKVLDAAIIPAVIPQAIFEAVVAAILTIAVVAAWKSIERGRGGSSV